MHSGFATLRSALPMNLKARFPGHKVWAGAQGDIERIIDDLARMPGHLRRAVPVRQQRSMADAMYAPVVTRFLTYDVQLDKACAAYCQHIMAMPEMKEWIAAAKLEPEEIDELDMEF